MTHTETHADAVKDALLHLAIPRTLEEEIADFLLLHPALASGFTMIDAQGMGQGVSLLSAMEKVQGRCKRKLILVAGTRAQLLHLLELLKKELPSPDVAYWITPLLAFGRLA